MKLEISLHTANFDLHSGRYSGAVRNALHELCALLATLHDVHGKVAVAGFDSDAGLLTQTQRADAQAFPFDAELFLADVGAVEAGDRAYSLRERITLSHALELNGIWGGYMGPGSKTVIPREAHAKMSIRIVPGQEPERVLDAVKEHLAAGCPPGVRLQVDFEGGGSPASSLNPHSPLILAAERVLLAEHGRGPLHVRLGATVPITAVLKETMASKHRCSATTFWTNRCTRPMNSSASRRSRKASGHGPGCRGNSPPSSPGSSTLANVHADIVSMLKTAGRTAARSVNALGTVAYREIKIR